MGVLRVGIGDSLTKSGPHSDMIGEICSKPSVEICVGRLKMCSEAAILHWQIIVLFLVHLFVYDILLSDLERTTCPSLVDLRSAACRFDASFQASVTATGSSDVSSDKVVRYARYKVDDVCLPFLILFVGTLSLDWLGRGHGANWRHCEDSGDDERMSDIKEGRYGQRKCVSRDEQSGQTRIAQKVYRRTCRSKDLW